MLANERWGLISVTFVLRLLGEIEAKLISNQFRAGSSILSEIPSLIGKVPIQHTND